VTDLEPLTKRSIQLLKTLFEKGKSTNTYTLRVKQDELSAQLGVSRQALNVHLRKLKNRGYIRTGRGFIDVTEKGLAALGVSTKSPRSNAFKSTNKFENLQCRELFELLEKSML
jgi:predicted transcriptional regulator